MKKLTLILLGLALSASALAVEPAPLPAGASDLVHRTPPPAAPASTAIADLTKERDDAKAQLANALAQQQQTSIAAEYYKAVAERNQALLQIVQLQTDLTKAQQALAEVTAERDKLAAAGAKAAALVDKLAETAPKK